MRPFWIGLVAGVVLVGAGVVIGVSVEKQRFGEVAEAPAPAPDPTIPSPTPPTPTPQTGAVRISGAQSNAGWIIYFHLPERARTVEYRRADDAGFTALGPNPHDVDLATGKPRPKTYAMLRDLDGPTRFAVRYTSDAGEQRGPFELDFDPTAESIKTLKSLLDDLPSWVDFRDYEGRRLVYFTTLLVYKPALADIRYGVDRAEPDRSLRFLPSSQLGIDASDQMYIPLPAGSREVVVEVVLRDGTRMRERFPTTPTIR